MNPFFKGGFALILTLLSMVPFFGQAQSDTHSILDSLGNVSKTHTLSGQYDSLTPIWEAMEGLGKGEANPLTKAKYLFYKGTSLTMQKNTQEGLKLLEEAKGLLQGSDSLLLYAKALGNYSIALENSDRFEEARQWHTKALNIRIGQKDTMGLMESYHNLGVLELRCCKNFDEAEVLYKKALSMAEMFGNKNRIARSFNNLGQIAYEKGEHKKAIELHKKALEIRKNENLLPDMALSHLNLSASYYLLSDFDAALESALLALDIRQKLGNKAEIAACMINIGLIYKNQLRYDKAAEYMQQAVDIFAKENEGSYSHRAALTNFGQIQYEKGDAEAAIKTLKLAEKLTIEAEGEGFLPFVHSRLGSAYKKNGQCKTALGYYISALSAFVEKGMMGNIPPTYNGIAECHLELGQPDSALTSLQESERLLNGQPVVDFANNLHLFSMYHEQKGDYGKALEFYKKYDALADSLSKNFNMESVVEMQERYENAKKTAENAQLLAENEAKTAQMRLQYTGLLFLSLLALVFFWFYWQGRQKNQLLTEQNDKITIQNKKIDELLTYIKHNTKNQLGHLVSLINIQNRQLADDAPSKQLLAESKGRLEAIKNLHLLLLEKSPSQDNINLREYLQEQLDSLKKIYPQADEKTVQIFLNSEDITLNMNVVGYIGLMLNEVVTNIVKHIQTDDDTICISVNARLEDMQLMLTVQDNGRGFEESVLNRSSDSFGFTLLEGFAANCGGSFSIKNDGGAVYIFQIPINQA